MTLFTDSVQSALERAMDGVALRQRVSAQNIANVMTPKYQAQQVSFESNLSAALAGGSDPASASLDVTGTGAVSDASGNNVDLATESTSLMKSGLQYDALVQATNYRLSVLRTALR
ncbi:MAG: flagellar basal-body rod protein FlgB [Frankiales bacterium]|nr:flagellar basal-body rod protein FlgB [Frankiales bacterium]